ncbi:MAG: hypothetical protein ACFFEV_09390 [Candidatus Thorarchaeota archaeon]
MKNNEETIADTEIELDEQEPDTEEPEKVSEVVLVLEVFRYMVRILVLGIVVFLLVSIDVILTLDFSTIITSFFVEMIPMALLFMSSGTAVVGILIFLNNRINLSFERRELLDRLSSHIDFIVSCVIVSVSLFFLPSVLDWISKISSTAQLDMYEIPPGYPIYGIQILLRIIARFIILELLTYISVILLYGAIFYRFASRVVRLLDEENKFTLTYIDRSGKSYLYAIGLILGYIFIATDVIVSDIIVVYLMLILLPFALAQRYLAKNILDNLEKSESEILTTPLDRFTKWYSFATKRTYRWLILIGIFVSLGTVFNSLMYLSYSSFFVQWELLTISSIAAVGFSTLYFVSRSIAVLYWNQKSAIGSRMRIESACDLIVSAMVFVVALSIFITEIGPMQWYGMLSYLENAYYPFLPYNPFQILITATLWQAWMVLFLLAIAIRLYATAKAFADTTYQNELRNSKLLARSGKILIIALSSMFSVMWVLVGTLYFGFLTDVHVFILLALIVLQTVLSQVRMKEMKLKEEVVN